MFPYDRPYCWVTIQYKYHGLASFIQLSHGEYQAINLLYVGDKTNREINYLCHDYVLVKGTVTRFSMGGSRNPLQLRKTVYFKLFYLNFFDPCGRYSRFNGVTDQSKMDSKSWCSNWIRIRLYFEKRIGIRPHFENRIRLSFPFICLP